MDNAEDTKWSNPLNGDEPAGSGDVEAGATQAAEDGEEDGEEHCTAENARGNVQTRGKPLETFPLLGFWRDGLEVA
jgi:hypothetical protein